MGGLNPLRVRVSIAVNASVSDVFSYLADFRLHGEWDGYNHLRVLETSSGSIGPGFVCRRLGNLKERYSSGTRSTRTIQRQVIRTQTMIAYLPNQHLQYEDASSDDLELVYRVTFDVTPKEGGGAIVTRSSKLSPTWWMTPGVLVCYATWPLVYPLRLLNQRRYLRRIKERLELKDSLTFPYLGQKQRYQQ